MEPEPGAEPGMIRVRFGDIDVGACQHRQDAERRFAQLREQFREQVAQLALEIQPVTPEQREK